MDRSTIGTEGGSFFPQQRTTIDIIDAGGVNPILPNATFLPDASTPSGGTGPTPLSNGLYQIGQYTNDDDDENSISPNIAFEDEEIFDGLRYSKPFTPNIREAISAFAGKNKGVKMYGLVSGLHFGQPETIFRRIKQPSNFTGPGDIEFYEEIFPEELSDQQFEYFLDQESELESFLGLGKKAKANREVKKAKRVERKENRRTAISERKSAKVDRKNKRVEIKAYKAETKRVRAESGEPTIFDKVLNTAEGLLNGRNDMEFDNSENLGGYNEAGEIEEGGIYNQNGEIASAPNFNLPNFNQQPTKLGFGGNKTVMIIIGLALVGAVIYYIKNKN